MLTGEKIISEIKTGNIVIEPFHKKQTNPNSYNVTLSKKLFCYIDEVLDVKRKNSYQTIIIPEEGYVLLPGVLYLGETREYTECKKYVPQLSGRSSIGRIGMAVHSGAGLGSIGFKGKWILGISCLKPTRVFEGMEIGQLYYHPIEGDYQNLYKGRYQQQNGIPISKSYQDFSK